jgi:hypothetical protein
MKPIYLSIISTSYFFATLCGCHCSTSSSKYYKNKEQREKRAERKANALERQRLVQEYTPAHRAPTPEYLQKYGDAQTIHHNRKMDDLKRRMKEEQKYDLYTGP